METRLKQRMIGAIVLTALAIIILPMLLDGSAKDRARVIARIPEPPGIQLKKLTIGDIDRQMQQMEARSAARVPHLVESAPKADVTSTGDSGPQPSASPERNGAPAPAASNSARQGDRLSLDKNDLPVSWTLQLASFKNQENALKLREDLRAASYRSYIIAAKTEQGDLYRVFVGPMLDKDRLDEVGKQVEARFDLKGRITRYRIEDDAGQLGG